MEQEKKRVGDNKKFRGNAETRIDKTTAMDTSKEIHPENEVPDRQKIAEAAVARKEKEEAEKKARREKDEMKKEDLKRVEEEKIESMKREAAKKSEALEKKDAIKSEKAKQSAAAAAEGREKKVEAGRLTAAQINSTPEISLADKSKGRENANSYVMRSSQEYVGEKTKVNESNKDATIKKNTSQILEKGESEMQLPAAAAAAAAAAKRAAEGKHTTLSSSLNEIQEKEASNINPCGVRPKEQSQSKNCTAKKQPEQMSDQTYQINRKSTANNLSEQTSNRPKKEIVTVEGSASLKSKERPQIEMSREVEHQNGAGNESEEPPGYKENKSDTYSKEQYSPKKMKMSEVEVQRKEFIQGCQRRDITGNREVRHHTREGNQHNHNNQQYYTPSPQNRGGIQGKNQQHYSKEQKNHNNSYDMRREQHPTHTSNSPSHHPHIGAQQMVHSKTTTTPRALMCQSCNEKYNAQQKLPRNLFCGHSMCSLCILMYIAHRSFVPCTICGKRTWYVKKDGILQFAVNEPLVQMLTESFQNFALSGKQEWKSSDARQYHSHPGRDKTARSVLDEAEGKSLPPKSPHGSKCLEVGVLPSCYCSSCQVWLCNKCAQADHSLPRCVIKSKKEQLTAMKQKNEDEAKNTQELLSKALQSLENNLHTDKFFHIWLKVAIECVEKKQKCMMNELKEGTDLMTTLTDASKSMSKVSNLPEALTAFERMEETVMEAIQWVSSADLGATGDDQEKTTCFKHLLRRTLTSLGVENGTSEIVAVEKAHGAELHSKLRINGARVHLHALRRSHPTTQAVQALPVECFTACHAAVSSLVFLNLSWDGKDHGCVYIRLTGDTLRGRQFISLCVGEGGVSFRGTCFHRVWWKGKPGEHIWTGDYDKGDGSGGKFRLNSKTFEDLPGGRQVPISAGLVAGRYEEEISSIFRIYTRAEKDAKDEAGFGQVEFGLDVVREAVSVKNISDVVISDCGLVLEM